MAHPFRIDIITPEDTYFSGKVLGLIAPGALGSLGIWANHAPLVTPLIKGRIELRMVDHSQKVFSIEGGFLEVGVNQTILLTEKITPIELPLP